MSKLARFSARLDRAVTAVCAALLLTMLGISFTGALYQAIVGDALSWTYSLARQFVPWIALLSITVAFRNTEHVAMTLITNALPPFARSAVQWIILAAIAAFGLVLLIAGGQFAVESDQMVMINDQIQFSQRWIAACLPSAGAILLLHLAAGRALIDEKMNSFAHGFDSDTELQAHHKKSETR